jgi:hypothetical protein
MAMHMQHLCDGRLVPILKKGSETWDEQIFAVCVSQGREGCEKAASLVVEVMACIK